MFDHDADTLPEHDATELLEAVQWLRAQGLISMSDGAVDATAAAAVAAR